MMLRQSIVAFVRRRFLDHNRWFHHIHLGKPGSMGHHICNRHRYHNHHNRFHSRCSLVELRPLLAIHFEEILITSSIQPKEKPKKRSNFLWNFYFSRIFPSGLIFDRHIKSPRSKNVFSVFVRVRFSTSGWYVGRFWCGVALVLDLCES